MFSSDKLRIIDAITGFHQNEDEQNRNTSQAPGFFSISFLCLHIQPKIKSNKTKNKAKQSRAEQSRAEQSRAEQSKAKQSKKNNPAVTKLSYFV